jgi:predicted aminopeptidase
VADENNNSASAKTEEFTALVQEIRDRVRARYPGPDALKHLNIARLDAADPRARCG